MAASGTGFLPGAGKCFEIRKWRCTPKHRESIKKPLNCTFKKVNTMVCHFTKLQLKNKGVRERKGKYYCC